MMQRLLSPWFTRLLFTSLAMSLLFEHSVFCSPTKISLHQHRPRLESVVDRTAPNRLARSISAAPNNSSIAGYTYSGCYADTESALLGSTRSLLGDRSYTSATGMTWNACTAYCNGYQYAGITGGSTCKCGNTFSFSTISVLDTLCSTPCTGNSLQSCGSSGRLTVFRGTNFVSTSPSPSAVLAISAVVALPPLATVAPAISSTLVPAASLTPRPSTLSSVTSLAAPPTSPITSVSQIAAPGLGALTPLLGAGSAFPAPSLSPVSLPPLLSSGSSPSVVLPSTLVSSGLSAAQPSTSPGIVPVALISSALSLAGLVSQVITISPSSASTFAGPLLGVSAPTAQSPTTVTPSSSVIALSLSASTQIPASQPFIPIIPLSPANLFGSTVIASKPLNSDVSSLSALVDSNAGPFALPTISGGAASISTLPSLAALANIQLPTASQTLAQLNLPVTTSVLSISPTSATTTASTIAQTILLSQNPIAPQALAPIAPVLVLPAPLIISSSSAAIATPAPILLLAPSSSLVGGVPLGVDASPSAAFAPIALAIGSLGPLGGSPINPSAVVLQTTISSTTVSSLVPATQLPFSVAPILQLTSSIGLPSIDLALAGAQPSGSQRDTTATILTVISSFAAALLPANSGITPSQFSGPQFDAAVTLPIAISSLVTPLLPASLLPAVPTLPPAIPNTATLLPFSIVAQQPVALIPTVTSAPAALIPDTIPFDQQLALPSDGATPWWVVTEFLEPHGLPTESSYLLSPPLLIPEPTVAQNQDSLPAVTNLLAPILAPVPSSVDIDSLITDDPAATFPDVFAFDPDDFPWPFAAPYSPQAQPPILKLSFKLDAQGNLPTKKDITNRYAGSDSTESGVIETGKLIAKVWTYTFYDTGLVRIDDTFLSPWTNIWGFLPDGTRIGLDSAGVYIGWEKRVPYGIEMLDVMREFWLPPPQYFI